MLTSVFRSKFLAGLGLSLFLFCLSLLIMKPYVTEAWECAVTADVLDYQKLLQQIESDTKSDIYFWAWINAEGYIPKEVAPLSRPCSRRQGEKMQDWVNNKLWAYVYPTSYERARKDLLVLHELKQNVLNRMKNFSDQREAWWAPLSLDLKKICSLYQQVKRLSEVKLHMVSSCADLSANNLNHPCINEIKNVEKLVEKEEEPFKENLAKMETKWPYLEEIFKSRKFNCETQ